MGAVHRDLEADVNASFELPLSWQERDGTAKPLTSFDARMQVRSYEDDEDVLVNLTSAEGGGIVLAAAGEIDVFVSYSQMVALLPHRGKNLVYDLILVHKTNPEIRHKLLKGAFKVGRGVTRDA